MELELDHRSGGSALRDNIIPLDDMVLNRELARSYFGCNTRRNDDEVHYSSHNYYSVPLLQIVDDPVVGLVVKLPAGETGVVCAPITLLQCPG